MKYWESLPTKYHTKMQSPQISFFEISTIDREATLQAVKDKVAAKMREKIENETGETNICFTFRNLSEPRPGLIVNNLWEARADF